MNQNNQKVDFICIGGNKCATTWLTEILRPHSMLNISVNKEPSFFNWNFNKGFEWYFKNWKNEKGKKGEFSTHYLYNSIALNRIYSYFPDVKIIIMLRNPYERSLSHLRHLAREKLQKDSVHMIRENQEIINNSLYYNYLKTVFEIFDKENIHIVFFDEIKNEPRRVYKEICSFLEVKSDFFPSNLQKKIGRGYYPRYETLQRLKSKIGKMLRQNNLHNIIVFSKKIGISELFKIINNDPSKKEVFYLPKSEIQRFIVDLNKLKGFLESKYIENWIGEIHAVSNKE